MEKSRLKKIKLISLDLDGTLLNSERKIPEENRKSVQQAKERGIKIIVSSGSPYDLMPHEELKDLGISYAITANGSAVYEYPGRKCIYEESMDIEIGRASCRERVLSHV